MYNHYYLDFGDFNFGNVLLGPKHRQNRGITVLGKVQFMKRSEYLTIFLKLIFIDFGIGIEYVTTFQYDQVDLRQIDDRKN